LRDAVKDYDRLTSELNALKNKLESLQKESQQFPWLEQAAQLWESRGLGEIASRSWIWLIGSGIVLSLALVLALAGAIIGPPDALLIPMVFGSLVMFALGLALGVVHFMRTRRSSEAAIDWAERSDIVAGFEERIGRKPGGLSGLRAELETAREVHSKARHLEEQISDATDNRRLAADSARRLVLELAGEEVDEADLGSSESTLRQRAVKLDSEIGALRSELDKLAVDPSDVSAEPGPVAFSDEAMKRAEGSLAKAQEALRLAERDLSDLKGEAIRRTGDHLSTPWEEVLAHLRTERMELEADYRRRTARILAQIGVTEILMRIKEQEDDRIQQGLKDKSVIKVLKDVTQRYDSLEVRDGALVICSDTADYPMADLSTGAREQVLLALRMGFASRLAGGQPLFLILDDAFQHSDWPRRERLVNTVISMVEAGWQVSYLTMDDHLRDLFRSVGKKRFKREFTYHELP
jgi:uncharacterized protein YhaN